jgi:sugar/nucleoside kinase (ribokinase family)
MSAPKTAPDVIGFGALNIDYIASASKLSAKLADQVAEWGERFEWNVEGPVDDSTVRRIMDEFGAGSLDASLGGSAWNTIFALAKMRINVRLGYVGVVGRVDIPGLSFLREMDDCRIDRRFVWPSPDKPSGLCLSYIEDGERVMLTRPGANLEMARFIREHFEDLAAYLASARYVHVTSFLDDETPVELLRVLRRARERGSRMRISVDPGHSWAAEPSGSVLGILRLADYVFLTYREFKALGGHFDRARVRPPWLPSHEPDSVLAARILSGCRPTATVIVPKRYGVIDVFRAGPRGVAPYRLVRNQTLPEDDIKDTTGAGDALAAGLLAALAGSRLQVELGAYLGLSLARNKIRHRAFEGHADFPDLTHGFFQSAERPPPQRRPSRNAGVFIAHGAGTQWEAVRRFLEQECGVTVYSLPADQRGAELAQTMRHHLSRCDFGVCLLTSAADHGDASRAEQGVVHQAGILQGRYGFRRVAILVEEGCETFSNVAGLIRLDFPAGHVDSTFWQLERMLRREGVVPAA